MTALAKRLVACKRFRWMPGMLPLVFEYGEWTANPRLDSYTEESMWVSDKSVPDLTDPATLGCLLALVREAWGRPKLVPYYTALSSGQGWYVADRFCGDEDYPLIGTPCGSEAEALVAALEAAP